MVVNRVGFKDAKSERMILKLATWGPDPTVGGRRIGGPCRRGGVAISRSLGTWAISCTLKLKLEASSNLLTPRSSKMQQENARLNFRPHSIMICSIYM